MPMQGISFVSRGLLGIWDSWVVNNTMLISDAKNYVGQIVQITFADRQGRETVDVVEVFEVNFVPLYGPCLITDVGDIRLDRVITCALIVREARAA